MKKMDKNNLRNLILAEFEESELGKDCKYLLPYVRYDQLKSFLFSVFDKGVENNCLFAKCEGEEAKTHFNT